MTGEEFYAIHREAGKGFGLKLPVWDELGRTLQADWDVRAFEQDLRDREDFAKVYDDERRILGDIYADDE